MPARPMPNAFGRCERHQQRSVTFWRHERAAKPASPFGTGHAGDPRGHLQARGPVRLDVHALRNGERGQAGPEGRSRFGLAAGRLVNGRLPENSAATPTVRRWPDAPIDQPRPNGRCQSWADLQLFMFDRRVVAGLRPSSRGAGGWAFENPQVQVLVFRYTTTVALGDSAPHAVHGGWRPFWFVAVRWPRQAGMTLLTRRPLPSDRRPMPSCL